jgi:hypothetical protein
MRNVELLTHKVFQWCQLFPHKHSIDNQYKPAKTWQLIAITNGRQIDGIALNSAINRASNQYAALSRNPLIAAATVAVGPLQDTIFPSIVR